jgi:CheY-like chemotaxis protein
VARVLIAEPEPDLRSLAEQAVLEFGHEPLLLEDYTGDIPADVLLLAISADAMATASALRQHDPALPIVCTGTLVMDDEARGLRPVAYLVKPYTLNDLWVALARAVAPQCHSSSIHTKDQADS